MTEKGCYVIYALGQELARIIDQGPRDGHALLPTARELEGAMAFPALEADGREPALGPVSPFARRAPFSAGRAGAAAASRPDAARGDWRAHPEAEDGLAGPPPQADGPGAEVVSRERPATGARSSVTGQPPAAAQADGPEAEVVSRERPAVRASSEPARPPAARAGPAMALGELRAVSEGWAAERDQACGARPCFAREADGPGPRRARAEAAPRRGAAPAWVWESLAALPSVPPRRPMPAPRAADAWRPPIASGSPPEAGRRGPPKARSSRV